MIPARLLRLSKRQPLLAVTVLFLVGVVAGFRLPPGSLWLCAAGAAAGLAWLLWRGAARVGLRGVADVAAAALGVLCIGAGRAAWNVARLAQETETARALDAPQAFVCRVKSDVAVVPLTGAAARYTFDVGPVTWSDGTGTFRIRHLPVTASWYGSVYDGRDAPKPNEVWRLNGRLRVETRRNGQTHAYLSTGKGERRSLRLASAGDTWLGRLGRFQRDAVRRVTLGIEDWDVVPGLNQAMLLGSRNEMSEEMRRIFSMSGTIHVFAISGLHIALVATVLIFFARFARLPRLHWAFAVVPLLIMYTIVTGARPSAVRACGMAVCLLVAPLLGRKPNALAALLATALVLHFWQPSLLFNAGNVLSFSTVTGLIIFVPDFSAFFRRCVGSAALQKKIQMLDAADNRVQVRYLRGGAVVLRYVADVFAVALAAWLVSVPLTGYYFGRVPVGGLLANPVVTSCAFMVVTSGLIGLLASLASAWVAVCFNAAAGFFTMIMVRTAAITASVKWLSFETAPWSGWSVAAWFAGLAVLAVWIRIRRQPPDGLEWLGEGMG